MKTRFGLIMLVLAIGLMLTACSTNNANNTNSNNGSTNQEEAYQPTETTKEMVDKVLAEIEQPAQIDLESAALNDTYHLDPALLDQFTIKFPMMNVKTNEIALLKVKDAKDIPTVEAAVKQRAADVQKQFESYLPDQYENAKNYKLVTKGNFVLFIISDQADELEKAFETFFVKA